MKKLPIGISDFKTVITEDYFYIDKTLLIDDLWSASAAVIVMTRPRRFGKTLNLSMLRYFFEKSEESNAHLFSETHIWKKPEYHPVQGQYPVIFLSFKDCKEETFEQATQEIERSLAKNSSVIIIFSIQKYSSVMNKKHLPH